MWTIASKLEESCQVIRAWGFEVQSGAVWVKDSIGMGSWFRQRHETLVLATTGTPMTLTRADLSGAHLSEANLRGAHLTGADLCYAKELIQAQLDKVICDEEEEGEAVTFWIPAIAAAIVVGALLGVWLARRG